MHRESISAQKNFIGLKPQMFSPVNLSTSMVCGGMTAWILATPISNKLIYLWFLPCIQ